MPVANKIESCTEQTLELSVLEIFLVSAAKTQLPLQIEDASRPEKSDVCRISYLLFESFSPIISLKPLNFLHSFH